MRKLKFYLKVALMIFTTRGTSWEYKYRKLRREYEREHKYKRNH